jgi:F0F1-type ATP synthase epsilon subunit
LSSYVFRGYADQATSDLLKFSLTCPHICLVSENVASVNVPAISGEICIMKETIPLITEINAGVVSIRTTSGSVSHYFVSPGFALKGKEGTLNVSVAEACPISDLDPTEVDKV